MSMITLLEGTPKELAWVALAHTLHMNHRLWVLQPILRQIEALGHPGLIVLALVDNQPAGVMVIDADQVIAFTHPQYRRIGVAKFMAQHLKALGIAQGKDPEQWFGIPTNEDGRAFFQAIDVAMPHAFEWSRECC